MKSIRMNRFAIPLVAVLALLGSVWIAQAMGTWQTSGRGDVLLDASGAPDPAGIKGWMTLDFVSQTYDVPLEALRAMIGSDPDIPAETELKDLEKLVPGMEVSSIRLGVAAYQDGGRAPADGPYGAEELPAADSSEAQAAAPPEPETPVPAATDHVPQGAAAIAVPEDGSPLPGSDIRGRMTLQEVVDRCQVPLGILVAELGLPEDVDTGLAMRDLASQMGIEVLTVREVVTRYQTQR
jgi:hypothetical protein